MNPSNLLALSSPFDMGGSDFLKLFWVLAATALVGGILIRRFYTIESSSTSEPEEPSPYEVACLAGPPERAVHAAVAQLCQDGMITVDPTRWQVSFVAPGEVASRAPIEQAVLRTVAGQTGVPFSSVEAACAPALADLQSSLRAKRLILPAESARLAWLIPCLIVAAVQLLGLIRFFIGLSRHKPIAFLVISWLIFGFVSSLVLGRRPYRTKRGDRLLASLKAKYAELKREADARAAETALGSGSDGGAVPAPTSIFSSMALPLAVGVLGYSVLAGGPADGMYQRMRSTGGGDGGVSSGDSGGSSDGGGDGGGGGCGGCGGGGD